MAKYLWFFAAWVTTIAGLACMAWIYSQPLTSWQFFGSFAAIFTFCPLASFFLIKGLDECS